jgi:sulfite reductase beta subunit-like hemoprotein
VVSKDRLSVLACIGAQACTAAMSATIAGIMTMIRTSRIENIGSAIGLLRRLERR